MSEPTQGNFEGWAVLEIFGHQKYAGYVKTENFGAAAMFRCDVPPLEERQGVTRGGCYVQTEDPAVRQWAPPGSMVKKSATQGYSKLFGIQAIFSATPCTQEACLKIVEDIQPRPLMLVSLPAGKALPEPESFDADAFCYEQLDSTPAAHPEAVKPGTQEESQTKE